MALVTQLSVDQASALIRELLPTLAQIVMDSIVDNLLEGMNADGGDLHVPVRIKSGGGRGNTFDIPTSAGGLGSLFRKQKSRFLEELKEVFPLNEGNKGGPGVDTGSMLTMLSSVPYFKVVGDTLVIDIDLAAGSVYNILAEQDVTEYVEEYEDNWANGDFIAASDAAITSIVNEIKRALLRR